MKILIIHNEYKKPGGEDVVLNQEEKLLKDNNHTVEKFIISNNQIDNSNLLSSLKLGLNTIWSKISYRDVKEKVKEFKPDIVHIHNTFPLLSPSIYWAIKSEGVPVVQTVHNYRLTCANGLLLKGGKPCEECIGSTFFLPGIKNKCYRNSTKSTIPVTSMLTFNKLIGTYNKKIDGYITLTSFAKEMLSKSNIPSNKIYVKPNFINAPFYAPTSSVERKNQYVFLGRAAHEKGLDLLLDSVESFDSNFKLLIVGDGPQKDELQEKYKLNKNIIWKGWLSRESAINILKESKGLIIPSRVYEGFPLVCLESLSVGTPIIAPNHAGFPEIVKDNMHGYLFKPSNNKSLQENIEKLFRLSEVEWQKMSNACRDLYIKDFSPESNYKQLMNIYYTVLDKEKINAHIDI